MSKYDDEPKPPWIVYPDNDPLWGGWRQGTSEHWLKQTWIPYVRNLSQDDRNSYFERYVPPDEEWLKYAFSWAQKAKPRG